MDTNGPLATTYSQHYIEQPPKGPFSFKRLFGGMGFAGYGPGSLSVTLPTSNARGGPATDETPAAFFRAHSEPAMPDHDGDIHMSEPGPSTTIAAPRPGLHRCASEYTIRTTDDDVSSPFYTPHPTSDLDQPLDSTDAEPIPRPPSPAETEIADPESQDIIADITARGIIVRDYAYAPPYIKKPLKKPLRRFYAEGEFDNILAEEMAASSLLDGDSDEEEEEDIAASVTKMNPFTPHFTPTASPPRLVTEMFDQYRALTEVDYRWTQVPRVIPIEGKTSRRLLDIRWLTYAEWEARAHQMDLRALAEYDKLQEGFYAKLPEEVRGQTRVQAIAAAAAAATAKTDKGKGKAKEVDVDLPVTTTSSGETPLSSQLAPSLYTLGTKTAHPWRSYKLAPTAPTHEERRMMLEIKRGFWRQIDKILSCHRREEERRVWEEKETEAAQKRHEEYLERLERERVERERVGGVEGGVWEEGSRSPGTKRRYEDEEEEGNKRRRISPPPGPPSRGRRAPPPPTSRRPTSRPATRPGPSNVKPEPSWPPYPPPAKQYPAPLISYDPTIYPDAARAIEESSQSQPRSGVDYTVRRGDCAVRRGDLGGYAGRTRTRAGQQVMQAQGAAAAAASSSSSTPAGPGPAAATGGDASSIPKTPSGAALVRTDTPPLDGEDEEASQSQSQGMGLHGGFGFEFEQSQTETQVEGVGGESQGEGHVESQEDEGPSRDRDSRERERERERDEHRKRAPALVHPREARRNGLGRTATFANFG